MRWFTSSVPLLENAMKTNLLHSAEVFLETFTLWVSSNPTERSFNSILWMIQPFVGWFHYSLGPVAWTNSCLQLESLYRLCKMEKTLFWNLVVLCLYNPLNHIVFRWLQDAQPCFRVFGNDFHFFFPLKLPLFAEAFSAPVFQNGPDKNGFNLGFVKNLQQVFGEEKKLWLLPIASR